MDQLVQFARIVCDCGTCSVPGSDQECFCPQCNSRLHTPLWVDCLTVIPFYWLLDFYPQYVRPRYGSLAVFALANVVFLLAVVFRCDASS